MEIFQTIWTALTTPNETLVAILSFPIYFVEAIVNMLLFTCLCRKKFYPRSIWCFLKSSIYFTFE